MRSMVAYVSEAHDGIAHEFLFQGQVPIMHAGAGLPVGEICVLEGFRARSNALRSVESDRVGAVFPGNDRRYADQTVVSDTVRRLRGIGQLIVLVKAREWRIEPHEVVPAVDGNQVVIGAESAAQDEALMSIQRAIGK